MTHTRREHADHLHGAQERMDAHIHDDRSGRWSRARHRLSELLGGHSHSPAEQVDPELTANRDGRRALLISMAALGLTFAAQAVVVALSGSVALLGDALHNLVDALTAVPLLVAFRLGRRRPTARYTYGYGRAEDIAGLLVVAMIALSAALVCYESVDRLLHPRPVHQLWAVAAAGVIGLAGNEIVAAYRIRVGRRIGSAALIADGMHARTDGLTSLAVVVGAAGVGLGFAEADAAVGLVIALAILGVLRSASREVVSRLMDAVDPQVVEDARAAISDVDGVRDIADIRVRWIGHTLRAEDDLSVDPTLTLAAGHEVAHHAEAHLLARVPRLTAATVHVSPAGVHG
jgi:cation diffusion facilitator family transporter